MDLFEQPASVKHLKSFYDAVAHGDFTAARQFLDPNLEWIGPDTPGLWFSGTQRGPDAVFQGVFEPATGRIANFWLKMKKFYEVGEHVIAVGRVSGRIKMTGKELDAPVAHIWTLREGKAVRCQTYYDSARWLEALGATSQPPEQLAA
ncbi:MAG TPA: nuclear transport factor 2 family protein [Bacillota bacterium]|nr:nuclear transport factor 2 family protein [Bacillota bacterium]